MKDSILPSGIEATTDINAIIEPEITDQTDPEIGNINESNVIKSEAMTTTTKSEVLFKFHQNKKIEIENWTVLPL